MSQSKIKSNSFNLILDDLIMTYGNQIVLAVLETPKHNFKASTRIKVHAPDWNSETQEANENVYENQNLNKIFSGMKTFCLNKYENDLKTETEYKSRVEGCGASGSFFHEDWLQEAIREFYKMNNIATRSGTFKTFSKEVLKVKKAYVKQPEIKRIFKQNVEEILYRVDGDETELLQKKTGDEMIASNENFTDTYGRFVNKVPAFLLDRYCAIVADAPSPEQHYIQGSKDTIKLLFDMLLEDKIVNRNDLRKFMKLYALKSI
jgi:hypothetical protein